MTKPTLDQLIDDVEKINKSANLNLPYNLHGFFHKMAERGMMEAFEAFLLEYRASRNSE
jgi:hypothetical protein